MQRVTGRWPAQRALLGGARVDDLHGAPPQRERGPEYVVVFVSEHFDGVPWLERVYVRVAVGRLRDGRARRRPLLHAGGVRAQAGDARGPCARRPSAGSSCCPSQPDRRRAAALRQVGRDRGVRSASQG